MTADAPRRRALGQILLLAAAFLVLMAISAASVVLVDQARKDSALVVHTVEVESQVNALLLDIRRAESAARGYLLTSGPEFLRDHEAAVATIPPELEKLAQAFSDNPAQVETYKKLRPAVECGSTVRAGNELRQSRTIPNAAALVREVAAADTGETIRRSPDHAGRGRPAVRGAHRDRGPQPALGFGGDRRRVGPRDRACRHFDLPGAALLARARPGRSQLRDNNLNLEATVDERTADLREANDEIQRFAYIVSHDLRSPLVNIMGFTSELENARRHFRRIATLARAAIGRAAGARKTPPTPPSPCSKAPTSSSRKISPKRSASSNRRSPRWTA